MIICAGEHLKKESGSDEFWLIMDAIEGANQWLKWALESRSFSLSVWKPEELLTRIQEGLHGPALMNLPESGLLVHPYRLSQLSKDDLPLILKVSNTVNKQKLKKTLKQNGLYTIDDFDKGLQFLENLDVKENIIFKVMSVADQIQLYELSQLKYKNIAELLSSGEIQKESADFAVSTAQSCSEFVSRYIFFMASLEKYPESSNKTSTRTKQAQVAWDNLSDYCNCLLETFSLGKSFYNNEQIIASEISNSILNGFDIGFQSKATAMNNVLRFTDYGAESNNDIPAIIKKYQTDIKNVIRQGKIDKVVVSQDGRSQSYVYLISKSKVIVNVDTLGIVTVAYCKI